MKTKTTVKTTWNRLIEVLSLLFGTKVITARLGCILVLAVGTILSGCGGGSGSSAPGAATGTVTITVKLIDEATQSPIQNVTVQLDASGSTTTITNSSGIATFSGIGAGAHDIHAFPLSHNWISAYGVNLTHVELTLSSNVSSFVNLTGTISNLTPASSGRIVLKTATSSYTGYFFSNGPHNTNTQSFAAPGSLIPSTVWGLEDSSVGGVTSVVDAVNLGPMTFTTNAVSGNSPSLLNIAFNVAKPAVTTLANISSVTAPSGISVNSLTAYSDGSSSQIMLAARSGASGLLSAYDPFGVGTLAVMAVGNAGAGGAFWQKAEMITKGATHIMLAAITNVPSITAGQSGNTITFTPASGAAIGLPSVLIRDTVSRKRWVLVGPSGVSNFTLPTLPVGVTPILFSGTNYQASVSVTVYNALTFEQFLSTTANQNSMLFEVAQSGAVSYTR
ncbi:MAG: hypothetical protein Q9M31_01675 [Mariprofundus sp.]|nr:hypothetical protein [Mariprofundus sp.]